MFIESADLKYANRRPATLTLLLVEDESTSRELMLLRLKGLFRHIWVAEDGTRGLQLFAEHGPDIVLSDQIMPGLSGQEMFRQIRALDQETPLILMTSSLDNEALMAAINLGVNRFIPKPFDYDALLRVLDDMVRESINRRELGVRRLQELELLRDRDSYNSIQQETARRKERHVVRHDLRNQLVTGANGIRWGLSVTHSPRDIMCGDGYTIRTLFDGRQLLFVVDAMGSGLSASLSALLATSFCNYQVDHLHQWQNFNLQLFLMRFQEYLGGILLEEEALCCGFLLVDLLSQKLEMAMFGLPPLLVRRLDGSTLRVPGSNPPLSIYSDELKFDRLCLAEVADVLVMTDGVTDASLPDGGSYRERLDQDFRRSPTLASLQRLFGLHTEPDDRDDLTLLHLQRLDFDSHWNWQGEPVLRREQLVDTIDGFLRALVAQVALQKEERSELELLLDKALVNALEHDCFGIDCKEKSSLPAMGACGLPRAALCGTQSGAGIALSASLWRGAERPLLIVEIGNNGPGLPGALLRISHEAGGLQEVGRHCDAIYLGAPGCRMLFLKTIEGKDGHAHRTN